MQLHHSTATTNLCSFFSTSTPTSGIPLGVIIASDEQQPTIEQGTSTCMLLDVLQQNAFFTEWAK